MKTFHCDQCAQQVFFENVRCENCGAMLGYEPDHHAVVAFVPAEEGKWRSLSAASSGQLYRQCVNYAMHEVCNWMLPDDSPHGLCASCRLTRVIPSLSKQKNIVYWRRLETAKRRLLYSLVELGLQPELRWSDPQCGLAFEFLEDMPHQRVMTGHGGGVITINIAEADPAYREKMRELMREPYRTLLGHFRHESGHFYFERLIDGSEWIERFRDLFGDERLQYGDALQTYYRDGPPRDWNQRFISAYASSHPWEDWAETWTHYLHIVSTLDTAFACGLRVQPRQKNEPTLKIDATPLHVQAFSQLMANWFALSYVLNSLNRSVGTPDAYPFTLSPAVIAKLQLIHEVILARRAAMETESIIETVTSQ